MGRYYDIYLYMLQGVVWTDNINIYICYRAWYGLIIYIYLYMLQGVVWTDNINIYICYRAWYGLIIYIYLYKFKFQIQILLY